MFADLDESLRQLLIREVPLSPNDVDIVFQRPDRDNVARFTKPTVNLFLFDLSENRDLRETGWGVTRNGGGIATLRWPPLRVDLRYLVTVWAQEVDDEHRLLYHLYRTLRRLAELPEEGREGLIQGQVKPLHLLVEDTELKTILDVWGVLDNHMQPSFVLKTTVAVDLDAVRQAPVVRTATTRVRPGDFPAETRHRISGRVLDADGKPVSGARVRSLRRLAETDAGGRFVLHLPDGPSDLTVSIPGREDASQTVTPPGDFDIALGPERAQPRPEAGASRGRSRRGGG